MARNFATMSESEFKWYLGNHIGIPAALGTVIGIEINVLLGLDLENAYVLLAPVLGLVAGALLGAREVNTH